MTETPLAQNQNLSAKKESVVAIREGQLLPTF